MFPHTTKREDSDFVEQNQKRRDCVKQNQKEEKRKEIL